MGTATETHLPDIIKTAVQKVNTYFSTRLVDPFSVFFDYGIYSQVGKNVYANPNNVPLVWLVMNFFEDFTDPFIFCKVECMIIIAMPTQTGYTQQQRDDINFKPRLIPIFDQLSKELQRSKSLTGTPVTGRRVLRPYWGGSANVNGSDIANLFDKNVDAISWEKIQLSVRNSQMICN